MAKGLNAVGKLDLVTLGAAEKLHPCQAFGGGRFDRVERVDETRRESSEARIEGQAMDVHAALKGEVIVERDRSSVKLQKDDSRHIEIDERLEHFPVEALADGRREPGAVRSSLPAKEVQPERLLQGGAKLLQIAGDDDFEPA